MKVYFISGLGADSRVFSYLKLPDNIEPVFVEWITPYKNEPLQSYARRMSSAIDTSVPFALIGLSFGGIIATEMAQFINPEKTILISSITARKELPFYYRLAGNLNLTFLLPNDTGSKANFLTYWVLGIRNENEKTLVQENFVSKSKGFTKWAINAIVNWHPLHAPKNLVRIHGIKDRLLPINNFTPDYIIKDGSHFMIVNKADEISKILAVELGA